MWTIVGLLIGVGFLTWMVLLGLDAMKKPYVNAAEGILGSKGVTKTALLPEGMVQTDGALWNAIAEEGCLPEGCKVIVTGVDGLQITVRAAGARPKQLGG